MLLLMSLNIDIATCTLAIGHREYYIDARLATEPAVLIDQASNRTEFEVEIGMPTRIQ